MAQPIADLWDDFNDGVIDSTKWTSNVGMVEANGTLCGSVPSAVSITTTSAWSLQQSSAFLEAVNLANGAGATGGQSLFRIFSTVDATDFVEFQYNAATNNLTMRWFENNVVQQTSTITYNATTMRWLRIREYDSSVYFETSPDGAVWTTQFTTTTQSWVSSVKVTVYHDQTGGTAISKCIDNFNIASASSRIVAVGSEFTVTNGQLGTNRCNKADAAWPLPCAVSTFNALRKSSNPAGLWVQPPAKQSLQVQSTSVSVENGDELSIITLELTNPDPCRGMLFYLPAVARMTIFSKKSDTVAVDAWTLAMQVTGVDNSDAGFQPLQADDIGAGYLTVNYIWCGSADYFWTAGPGETTTVEMKVKAFASGANVVTKFQAELGAIGMSVVIP